MLHSHSSMPLGLATEDLNTCVNNVFQHFFTDTALDDEKKDDISTSSKNLQSQIQIVRRMLFIRELHDFRVNFAYFPNGNHPLQAIATHFGIDENQLLELTQKAFLFQEIEHLFELEKASLLHQHMPSLPHELATFLQQIVQYRKDPKTLAENLNSIDNLSRFDKDYLRQLVHDADTLETLHSDSKFYSKDLDVISSLPPDRAEPCLLNFLYYVWSIINLQSATKKSAEPCLIYFNQQKFKSLEKESSVLFKPLPEHSCINNTSKDIVNNSQQDMTSFRKRILFTPPHQEEKSSSFQHLKPIIFRTINARPGASTWKNFVYGVTISHKTRNQKWLTRNRLRRGDKNTELWSYRLEKGQNRPHRTGDSSTPLYSPEIKWPYSKHYASTYAHPGVRYFPKPVGINQNYSNVGILCPATADHHLLQRAMTVPNPKPFKAHSSGTVSAFYTEFSSAESAQIFIERSERDHRLFNNLETLQEKFIRQNEVMVRLRATSDFCIAMFSDVQTTRDQFIAIARRHDLERRLNQRSIENKEENKEEKNEEKAPIKIVSYDYVSCQITEFSDADQRYLITQYAKKANLKVLDAKYESSVLYAIFCKLMSHHGDLSQLEPYEIQFIVDHASAFFCLPAEYSYDTSEIFYNLYLQLNQNSIYADTLKANMDEDGYYALFSSLFPEGKHRDTIREQAQSAFRDQAQGDQSLQDKLCWVYIRVLVKSTYPKDSEELKQLYPIYNNFIFQGDSEKYQRAVQLFYSQLPIDLASAIHPLQASEIRTIENILSTIIKKAFSCRDYTTIRKIQAFLQQYSKDLLEGGDERILNLCGNHISLVAHRPDLLQTLYLDFGTPAEELSFSIELDVLSIIQKKIALKDQPHAYARDLLMLKDQQRQFIDLKGCEDLSADGEAQKILSEAASETLRIDVLKQCPNEWFVNGGGDAYTEKMFLGLKALYSQYQAGTVSEDSLLSKIAEVFRWHARHNSVYFRQNFNEKLDFLETLLQNVSIGDAFNTVRTLMQSSIINSDLNAITNNDITICLWCHSTLNLTGFEALKALLTPTGDHSSAFSHDFACSLISHQPNSTATEMIAASELKDGVTTEESRYLNFFSYLDPDSYARSMLQGEANNAFSDLAGTDHGLQKTLCYAWIRILAQKNTYKWKKKAVSPADCDALTTLYRLCINENIFEEESPKCIQLQQYLYQQLPMATVIDLNIPHFSNKQDIDDTVTILYVKLSATCKEGDYQEINQIITYWHDHGYDQQKLITCLENHSPWIIFYPPWLIQQLINCGMPKQLTEQILFSIKPSNITWLNCDKLEYPRNLLNLKFPDGNYVITSEHTKHLNLDYQENKSEKLSQFYCDDCHSYPYKIILAGAVVQSLRMDLFRNFYPHQYDSLLLDQLNYIKFMSSKLIRKIEQHFKTGEATNTDELFDTIAEVCRWFISNDNTQEHIQIFMRRKLRSSLKKLINNTDALDDLIQSTLNTDPSLSKEEVYLHIFAYSFFTEKDFEALQSSLKKFPSRKSFHSKKLEKHNPNPSITPNIIKAPASSAIDLSKEEDPSLLQQTSPSASVLPPQQQTSHHRSHLNSA